MVRYNRPVDGVGSVPVLDPHLPPLVCRTRQRSKCWNGCTGLGATFAVPFMGKLAELGYVDGKNVSIERRSAEGNVERLSDLAADIVRQQVHVIVTAGTPAAFAAKKATSTIPIVLGANSDPAIDWAERALRLSPFDRLKVCSYHALAIGHFLRERYEQAADAGRRAVQCDPGFSVSQSLLVAPLVKLGRIEEANTVARRVVALQPSFSAGGFCAALALPAALATLLTEAWRIAGLPP